jgi:hypothetical protein
MAARAVPITSFRHDVDECCLTMLEPMAESARYGPGAYCTI